MAASTGLLEIISLWLAALARYKLLHNCGFQNVWRQKSLRQNKIVKRLLVKVFTQCEFSLSHLQA